SGTFVISNTGKAPATVTLSNLSQTYTGGSLTPTATTNPAGLNVTFTGAPQTAAGSYPVTATINDPNYEGSASNTFVIGKANATVTLSGMTQAFTGSPLTPTASTVPAGLNVVLTGVPQTATGNYPVTATINDANYQGSTNGTFVISNTGKAPATVTLSNHSQTYTGGVLFSPARRSSALLNVTFTGAPQTA